MRRVVLLAPVLGAWACTDQPTPERRPAAPSDKAALFGDPGLVPTREGERARTEAAQAAEIQAAIALVAGVESVRADVELQPRPRAVVVVRLSEGGTPTRVVPSAERIATGILGPSAQVVVEASAAPSSVTPLEPSSGLLWPVGVALVGLGFSLGLSFDRTRRLLRRRRRKTS